MLGVPGLSARDAAGQVHKEGEGLIPNVDFPDRYDIFEEPFPDRPVTPLAEVIRMGKGPIPMVLIPGVGGDWTVWLHFMERNADQYTMYAVTLPGFGGSNPPPSREDEEFGNLPFLRNAVKAIVGEIDARGLDRPVIVGHGLGGHLALWIGARYPGKTRAVVSIDGPPLLPLVHAELDNDRGLRRETINTSMLGPMRDEGAEEWEKRVGTLAFSQVTDGERAQQLIRMYMNCYRGVFVFAQLEYMMSDLRQPLSQIRVPTLILTVSAPDQPGGANYVRERMLTIVDGAANTTFVVVRNSRHYVMDDQPELLDGMVRQFIHGESIDNAFVSAEGTVKPVNPELDKAPAPAGTPQKP